MHTETVNTSFPSLLVLITEHADLFAFDPAQANKTDIGTIPCEQHTLEAKNNCFNWECITRATSA